MKRNFYLWSTVTLILSIMLFFSCESIKPVQPEVSLIQEKDQSSTTLAKIKTVPTGGLEEATVSPLSGETE